MKYGALPKQLGKIDLNPTEMMFWLYCPISLPEFHNFILPENLRSFEPIIKKVYRDVGDAEWYQRYIYLTAKTLYVEGNYIGNRPGWHSDGFGTEDLNYIWSDRAPTEFLEGNFDLSENCDVAMREMKWQAYHSRRVTFPDKELLKLTPACIHQTPTRFQPGIRTFVKVSVSKNRYDLVGNSRNHYLDIDWEMQPRQAQRNHPSSTQAIHKPG